MKIDCKMMLQRRLTFAVLFLYHHCFCTETNREPIKKNILLVFIENIDYLTKYREASDFANINKVISQSTLFTEAYSEMYSTSSASTLLTGKQAIDTGMIKGKILPFTEMPSVASSGGLEKEHLTIAELIKQKSKWNHKTAFVGYWKLGHGKDGMFLPHNRGFDYWTGVPFAHSKSCKGRQRSIYYKTEIGQQQMYVHLIQRTLPWWICVLIGILSAYYFKVISWGSFINALIFTLLSTLILYVLLKVYKIQKSASCVLYEMNEIIEQPYHPENMTMFFTASVLSFLTNVAENEQPFFLYINYLKLKEAHFSSKHSQKNKTGDAILDSLYELDWSIGKITKTLSILNLERDTMLIMTGNNECFKPHRPVTEKAAFERKTGKGFQRILAMDEVETCFHVPIYLRESTIKREQKKIESTVSFLDIAPTILKFVTNETYEEHNGCNLLQLIHFNADIDDNISQRIQFKESGQNDSHNCRDVKRIFPHYSDVTNPVAITTSRNHRIVFNTLEKNGMRQNPLIFMPKDDENMAENLSIYLEELFHNISKRKDIIYSKRKNKWSSQFEMPIYPWLLPCANFPRCEVYHGILEGSSFLQLLELFDQTEKQNDIK